MPSEGLWDIAWLFRIYSPCLFIIRDIASIKPIPMSRRMCPANMVILNGQALITATASAGMALKHMLLQTASRYVYPAADTNSAAKKQRQCLKLWRSNNNMLIYIPRMRILQASYDLKNRNKKHSLMRADMWYFICPPFSIVHHFDIIKRVSGSENPSGISRTVQALLRRNSLNGVRVFEWFSWSFTRVIIWLGVWVYEKKSF